MNEVTRDLNYDLSIYCAPNPALYVPQHKPSIYSTMGYITLPDDGEVLTFLDPRLAGELWGY